jgi:hypothetical protein
VSRSLADSERDSVTGRLIMKKRRETDVSVCKNNTRALPRPCLPRSAHWERSSRLLFRGVSILLSIRRLIMGRISVVSDELVIFVCCPRRSTGNGDSGTKRGTCSFCRPFRVRVPLWMVQRTAVPLQFHPPATPSSNSNETSMMSLAVQRPSAR